MPRLLDMLDAAAGLVPERLDLGVDYGRRRPSPQRLVAEDGTYNAGWFERFDGELNFEDSMALRLAFQRWYHLSFDAEQLYVVCNIADLTKAGNVAVLVVDKATGEHRSASLTRLYPTSGLEISGDLRRWRDADSGSFMALSEDLDEVSFSVHAEGLHLSGIARGAVGPPWVQVTRYHRGRGCIQWYGNLELVHGQVSWADEVRPLAPGTLGVYDRTAGHRPGLSAWNWLATAGVAVDEATGERVQVGVQIARDRPMARPQVDGRKFLVWVDGELHKLPAAEFRYETLDEGSRRTGPWRIVSPGVEVGVDLRFQPAHHRRERKRLGIVDADFNQYYGRLSGRVVLPHRALTLEGWFTVCEESRLEI